MNTGCRTRRAELLLLMVAVGSILKPMPAFADWIGAVGANYAIYGKFATEERSAFKAETLALNLDYGLTPKANWSTELGLAAKLASVAYAVSGTGKSGIYDAIGLDVHRRGPFLTNAKIAYGFAFYPWASMTVGNVSASQINGKSTTSSSLTSFNGTQAFEISAAPEKEMALSSYSMMLRYGLYTSLFWQRFSQARAKARSSDETKTPDRSIASSQVSYNLLTLNLGIGLAIVF